MKSSNFFIVNVLIILYCLLVSVTEAQTFSKLGNIEMNVADYKKGIIDLKKVLKKWNATVAEEKEGDFTNKVVNNLKIRIPNQDYDLVIEDISTIASKVGTKTIKQLEISKEIKDLEGSIASKLEIKQKYTDLINRSKLSSEIDRSKKDIENLNNEIAQLEGRIRDLQDSQYGVLYLYIEQLYEAPILQTVKGETFNDLSKNTVVGFLRKILFFTVLPILLVLAGYWIYKKYRKIKRKRRSSSKSPW